MWSWFRKPKAEWEYGKVNNIPARRHTKNKNVQFVIWKKGEMNHDEDCWIDFDKSWWSLFKKDK